jgi:hypothetical protein
MGPMWKRFLTWLSRIGKAAIKLQCSFCGVKHTHYMAEGIRTAFMLEHWRERPAKCSICCFGRLQVKA